MELIGIARAVRRHIFVVLITFIVVVAIGTSAAYRPPDRYKATSVVLVQPEPDKQLQPQVVTVVGPVMVAQINSRAFRSSALEAVPADVRSADVAVDAADDGTGVFRISASSTRRDAVAPWATAFASELVNSDIGEGFVTLELLDTAVTPRTPYAPERTPVVLSSIVLGLILATVAAIAASAFRRRRDEADEIQARFGTAVLGEIPAVRHMKGELGGLTGPKATAAVVEALQSLRTSVQFGLLGVDQPSVALVSTASGEGKSTVSSALAQSLASSGTNVTLVDADFRRPMLHTYLGLRLSPGLASAGRVPVADLLQRTPQPNLSFLAAGVPTRHPAEVLPVALPAALRELSDKQGSLVLVDCPPLEGFADTAVITSLVHAVILVVDWRRRDLLDVEHALGLLHERGAKVLGIVINRSRRKPAASSYYYRAPERGGETSDRDGATSRPSPSRSRAGGGS